MTEALKFPCWAITYQDTSVLLELIGPCEGGALISNIKCYVEPAIYAEPYLSFIHPSKIAWVWDYDHKPTAQEREDAWFAARARRALEGLTDPNETTTEEAWREPCH